MCQNKWSSLDFSMIPGKVLNSLVSNKDKKTGLTTLQRHNLEKEFSLWVEKKPTVPFNGYVYELLDKYNKNKNNPIVKTMLNKQFDNLIKTAKSSGGITGNVWVALDTSGSMSCGPNKNIPPINVCISLGIYFSTLNQGAFHKNVIMFDSKSTKLKLTGNFCDMVGQIPQDSMGSTNFNSVVEEIIRVRVGHPNIPVEEYPTTILVISDMQFNPNDVYSKETNYEYLSKKFQDVGLPIPRFIWWDVTGYQKSHLNKMDDKGIVMLSGFDGAIVSQILGGENDEKTKEFNAHQNMMECLNQTFLNHLVLRA
jgi:hypothetical protein